MGELGLDEVGHLDALPLVLDQQILAGGEPVDAVGQSRREGCRVAIFRGLLGNGLHHGEKVLGAMIDLGHEQLDVLLGRVCAR